MNWIKNFFKNEYWWFHIGIFLMIFIFVIGMIFMIIDCQYTRNNLKEGIIINKYVENKTEGGGYNPALKIVMPGQEVKYYIFTIAKMINERRYTRDIYVNENEYKKYKLGDMYYVKEVDE